MKKMLLLPMLACFCSCSIPGIPYLSGRAGTEGTEQPVRPGIPGERPFWNTYSAWGFMYAPAFDFKEVAGATSYRFTLAPQPGGPVLSFIAGKPWAPLSPVWNKVPVGFVRLTVEGVDGGKVLGVSGTRDFYRKAPFEGKSPAAVRPYKESGELKLKHLYESSYVKYWLDHDSPDPGYGYYCYPSKMIGSVLVGLVRYARLEPAARDAALTMARHAADFLIRRSAPKGSFYAYFPPTYMGEHASAKGKNDVVMMNYPEEVSQGYLDLYDATRDKRYFEAAENIAKTYVKTQLANGTWPLSVKPKTGEAVSKNALVPIGVIRLLRRLDKQYGRAEFRPGAKMAMDWIIANPLKTFNWEGQFEDVPPSAPYANLSKGQACDIASYMLDNADEHPQYQEWAMDIIRFAEDQFVVWDRPNPDLKPANWLTPCALEQYAWMMPINDSASDLMLAWAAAYKRTGREIFRQKARALANAMTVSQLPDGELPTYWHHTNDCWMNCAVYAAISMIKLEEAGIQAVLPKKR
ncbi:MAG TPA: hypothetical protein DCS63_05230 [Elusimicrobia bacterium]|nr:hypothetical protein [Elusimicrobiota bacterium]